MFLRLIDSQAYTCLVCFASRYSAKKRQAVAALLPPFLPVGLPDLEKWVSTQEIPVAQTAAI